MYLTIVNVFIQYAATLWTPLYGTMGAHVLPCSRHMVQDALGRRLSASPSRGDGELRQSAILLSRVASKELRSVRSMHP